MFTISHQADGDRWFIEFDRTSTPLQGIQQISTPTVINATYAASNAINQLFEAGNLALTHELSEIAFVTSREFGDRGLTVMDGPFGSIMPYGCSGLLSLSSVAYTHHKISYEEEYCLSSIARYRKILRADRRRRAFAPIVRGGPKATQPKCWPKCGSIFQTP